jgi:2-desacetyl-2-hydroxyethyl bacteriochlorophyllide A dehydrogenase
MKNIDALVCLEPGSLKLQSIAAPAVPEGFALVRPARVGICGTDYHIFEGKHPFLQYPRIMGHELAVEVVEAPTGSGVETGKVYAVNPYLSCGQCVACRQGKPNCCVKISVLGVHQDGGMAGLLALPAMNLIKADGLSADECATVEFMAIGAHAVRRGQVTGGDKALVVGAGPIGLGAALFAKLSGADVAIYDRDVERAKATASLLGVQVIAAQDDAVSAFNTFTGGDGFSVVFDATGNARSMEAGFDHVGAGGRYVLVSVVKDPITFKDPDFHRKEMTLYGSRNATSEDFERVVTAIRAGQVPVDRIVTHRTTLAGAVKDLPIWAAQKSGLIKAVIEIS